MPLQHAVYTRSLRTAATLAVATNIDFTPGGTRGGTLIAVVTLVGRTAGNLTVQIAGSFDDGSTYSNLGAGESNFLRSAVTANGVLYFELSGALPKDLRIVLTPAGGLDGTVAVVLRSTATIVSS